MHRVCLICFGLFLALCLTPLRAEENKPAPAAPTPQTMGDLDLPGSWIYDDLEKGFAESRKTGKPLMIVFRCIP